MKLSPIEQYCYKVIDRHSRRFFDHRAKLPLEVFLLTIEKAHGVCNMPRHAPVSIIENRDFRWNPVELEHAWDRMLMRHEDNMAQRHLSADDLREYRALTPYGRNMLAHRGKDAEIKLRHLKRLGYQGICLDDIVMYFRGKSNTADITTAELVDRLGAQSVYGESAI